MFLVLAHDRRRIVHFAVTPHPTAQWTAQQLREAFPWDSAPQYLLRDRDRIFGQDFVDQVKAMASNKCFLRRDLPGRGRMSNGSLVPFAASVWITSSCSESALSVALSRRIFPITIAGALICRSAKTPRNSDEHRPALKVRWSRFVKSVVYIIITNARPPKSIGPCQTGSNLWGGT